MNPEISTAAPPKAARVTAPDNGTKRAFFRMKKKLEHQLKLYATTPDQPESRQVRRRREMLAEKAKGRPGLHGKGGFENQRTRKHKKAARAIPEITPTGSKPTAAVTVK